jgi:hypothetical protein
MMQGPLRACLLASDRGTGKSFTSALELDFAQMEYDVGVADGNIK